jgi:hypothetical protein
MLWAVLRKEKGPRTSLSAALKHSLYLSFFRLLRHILLFPILHEDSEVLYINDTITEGGGTDITE